MNGRLVLLLGLVLVAFAGNSLLTRAALDGGLIGATPFSVIRLIAGAAVLSILAVRQGQAWFPGPADTGGIVSLGIYVLGFTYAYLELGAGLGALLLFGMVQITTLAASLRSKEGFKPIALTGLIIAMVGLIVLLRPTGSGAPVLAYGLMIAAGLAWGFTPSWDAAQRTP